MNPFRTLTSIVGRAVGSGTAATATSTAALALMAAVEGKGLAQPLNATSHWLYEDSAANVRSFSADHTTIGFGTHYAATVFWALAFETSMSLRPARGLTAIAGRAASIATMAAIVDYTITPKRFTPGWELVLTKGSMALIYAAMGAGFAAAALRRERSS